MKPKYIVLSILNGASAVLFLIFTLIAASVKNSLPDQQTVTRWSDGSIPYAQVSIFTDSDSAMSIDTIFTARADIDKKLTENSLAPEKEGARLRADAFSSGQKKLGVSSSRASAEANVIATGGDFFLFHPLDLLSGSYYSDSDIMHDRVMLDEVLAWQLYGSSDIAGKPVIINGKYFYVAGVFRQDDSSAVKKVYGEKPRMFMSYSGMELLGETPLFTSYEVCLPNPVTGLAEKIVRETSAVSEDGSRIVENSARYGLKNRFGIIADFGSRSVVDSAVVYPYWENAARITEDRSALLLVFQALALVVPLLTAVYLFALLIHNRKKLFNKAADAVKRVFCNISKKPVRKTAKSDTEVSV